MKNKARSYSELRTFQTCNLQHYYRYFLRLSSKKYEDIKHFVPGRIVHNSIENVYLGMDVDEAVERVSRETRADFQEGVNKEFFDSHLFEIHRHMAYNLVKIFEEEILEEEPYEAEAAEYSYEQEVAGVPFVGHVDQIYTRPPTDDDPDWAHERLQMQEREKLRFIGEWKTCSSSTFPSSDYEEEVKNDLQSHLYLAAVEKSGLDVDGIVHTSLRKCPKKYRDPEEYDTLKEQKKEMDGYYDRSRVPYRRVELVWRPPFDELKQHLQSVEADIESFYENPFRSYDQFVKPDPKGFPCQFCEYFGICRQGKDVDSSWSYKKQRR